MKGKRLSEIEPIFEIISDSEVTIDIVLIPFDTRTAKYHLTKVMEILKMPEIYAYLKKDKKA